MIEIEDIIIVEGLSDKNHLSTFIKADILICNGSAIDGFSFDYLKELAIHRGIIILTDPDFPGEKIRNTISQQIPNCKHAFIDKKRAIKHHKVGVAECDQEEIIRALTHVLTKKKSKTNILLTQTDLYTLQLCGSDSAINKEKVCAHFHLGHCNSKTLLKRLNLLGITIEQIKEVLK